MTLHISLHLFVLQPRLKPSAGLDPFLEFAILSKAPLHFANIPLYDMYNNAV